MNHHVGFCDEYMLQYESLLRNYCEDNGENNDSTVIREIIHSTNIHVELGDWLEHMVSSLGQNQRHYRGCVNQHFIRVRKVFIFYDY